MVKRVSIAFMYRRFLITSVFVLVLGSSFKDPGTFYNISKGSIVFSSDAPLELIRAESNELKGLINSDKKEFLFSVNVRSFKGFNSGFQKEHFNENYLESDKYPTATFAGKIIEDVDFTRNNVMTVRAKGVLTVHGVPKERIIKSDMTIKNGSIFIKSNFTVLLADHNIPIPKVVHEKLASEIKVEVNSELKVR